MNVPKLFTILATACVAACAANNGGGTLPARPLAANVPAAAQHSDAALRDTRVTFEMHWPAHRVLLHPHGRTARYVSPSTMSVVVAVASGRSTLRTCANAPRKRAKTTTIAIAAPPGRDAFTIDLYDAKQSGCPRRPKGNLLGSAAVVRTIVAGRVNRIAATIDGVVKRAVLVPLPNQPYVEPRGTPGPDGSWPAYTLLGWVMQDFTVVGLDAGGNVIVPAPAASIQGDPGNTLGIRQLTTPPNTFEIVAWGHSYEPTSGAIVSATDALGNVVSSNVPLYGAEMIDVGYANAPAGSSKIVVYDNAGRMLPLPANAFAGVVDPVSISFVSLNPAYNLEAINTIYVGDAAQGKIFGFDTMGQPLAGFTPISIPNLRSMLMVVYQTCNFGCVNDRIYATDGTSVREYDQTGADVTAPGAFAQSTSPQCIGYEAADLNKAIVVVDATGTAKLYDTSGKYLNYSFSTGVAGNCAAAYMYTPSENEYFIGTPTSGTANLVGVGAQTYATFARTTVANPTAIDIDEMLDEVYYTSASANTATPLSPDLGTVDTAHVIAPPATSGLSNPSVIEVYPD